MLTEPKRGGEAACTRGPRVKIPDWTVAGHRFAMWNSFDWWLAMWCLVDGLCVQVKTMRMQPDLIIYNAAITACEQANWGRPAE